MSLESDIQKARLAEKELRYRFELEKSAEWQRVSADARAAIARAVVAAHRAGMKISKIAEAYGTKNRGTIYEILRKHDEITRLTPSAVGLGTLTVSHDPIGEADGFPNPYRVEAQNYTLGDDVLNGWVRIYFREPGEKPKVIEASEIGNALHNAILRWDDERFTAEIIRQIG